MLSKEKKKAFRADLFRHLDGLVMAPVATCLAKHGVLAHLLEHQHGSISSLANIFKANEGYLNVALRLLCSQGWLTQEVQTAEDEVHYRTNDHTAIAAAHFHLYQDTADLLQLSGQYHPRLFQKEPFQKLAQIFTAFKNQYGITRSEDPHTRSIQDQIMKHIEGAITAPSIVALGMNGMFHKYFMEASFRADEFHKDTDSFGILLDFFSHIGWFNKNKETYRFTDKGLFFAKRASAYGVTVSYQNTFRHLDSLIFGDPNTLWSTQAGEDEKHVDRTMNVWGSGGAHGAYFKQVDEIIRSIFNRPIHEQPKGIVDLGCGNGAYLQHLYEVIEQQTLRGTMLEDHPLFLVGADYNQAALKVTRANLISADIWAKVIWGDIGRPDVLADDLQQNYGIDLKDLLNVRTFLDHNRIWEAPKNTSDRLSQSTGSYAYRGQRINNNLVEENLLEHLQRWSPYVQKFGLLLIELHTIAPDLTAQHLGQTAATAYDATHGFSDQYIVEIPVFLKIMAEAGLHPDPKYAAQFPNSDLATVSINLFRA